MVWVRGFEFPEEIFYVCSCLSEPVENKGFAGLVFFHIHYVLYFYQPVKGQIKGQKGSRFIYVLHLIRCVSVITFPHHISIK